MAITTGIQPAGGVERAAGVFFFTTNNKVAFPAEELREAVPQDGTVIHQENSLPGVPVLAIFDLGH